MANFNRAFLFVIIINFLFAQGCISTFLHMPEDLNSSHINITQQSMPEKRFENLGEIRVSRTPWGAHVTREYLMEKLKRKAHAMGADEVIQARCRIYSDNLTGNYGSAWGYAVKWLPSVSAHAHGNHPPEIVIFEPAISRGAVLITDAENSIRVSGTATDPDGVKSVTVNGKRATLDSSGKFFCTLELKKTVSLVSVRATDNKNESSIKTFEYNSDLMMAKWQPMGSERIALVVGNSSYINFPGLKNPTRDATGIKIALESLGFKVVSVFDGDNTSMENAIERFKNLLPRYSCALFYYSGHGIQVRENNYVLPIDATKDSMDMITNKGIPTDLLLKAMEDAGVATKIMILDTCRTNLSMAGAKGSSGHHISFSRAPAGSFIAYSVSPGNSAPDGSENISLYTSALLKHIKTPAITIETVFKRVRQTLLSQGGGHQIPWEATSLHNDFYFNNFSDTWDDKTYATSFK